MYSDNRTYTGEDGERGYTGGAYTGQDGTYTGKEGEKGYTGEDGVYG